MKLQWNTSLRMTLCAVVVAGTSFAHAQTTTMPAPEASQAAPAVAPVPAEMQHQQPTKKQPKPRASKGKYATPEQHEAAAVAGERKRGVGPGTPSTDYERNALQRCEIFKTPDDRKACVERVRQPQISGSVQGGGWIREYTQTVQVPAPDAGTQPVATPPTPTAPQPQMAYPPVEPIRK